MKLRKKKLRAMKLISGGDSLVLQPLRGDYENTDRNGSVESLDLKDMYHTLKRKMMRNENILTIRKKQNGIDGQFSVVYEHISIDEAATSLRNTALVAYLCKLC